MTGAYNQIKEEVEAILVHSQDFPFDVDATKMMEQWEKAKAPFIKLFKGKTYIRSAEPIKVTLSSEQRSRRFNEFISTLDDNGVLSEDFETFLRVNTDGFFENKVVLPYPTYHIPQGAKILKSFKKFLPNQEVTRWAQDTASRYIQENKIEGYLYLSVDPRDFLTLSENDSNWYSCQSLDGDYRSGDLSYMVDGTTIVAYLANEKKHFNCLPQDSEWFDKKWRMLIHTNQYTCIYYNRQYPYDSPDLLEATHRMVSNLFPRIDFAPPADYGFKVAIGKFGNRMMTYNQINAGGRTYDMRDIVDTSDYLGYCDLVSSSTYSPVVAVNFSMIDNYLNEIYSSDNKQKEEELFKEIFGIKVGAKVICPVCGEEYLNRDDKFLCDKCIAEKDADVDFFLTCHSCYRRIYDEDEIYFEGTEPFCGCCHRAMTEELLPAEEEEKI